MLRYTATFAEENVSEDLYTPFLCPVRTSVMKLKDGCPEDTPPFCDDDFILLTPKDILTKDETWINHSDMIHNFEDIPDAVDNDQLRAEINNYFYSMIPRDKKGANER